MTSFFKRNNALSANPIDLVYPLVGDINITTHGSNWLWAVTAVMALFTLIFLGWGFTVPPQRRVFHQITAMITFVACIAYFTMASNLGYAVVPVEFQRSDPKVAGMNREIFYVRYIDWTITTPLLLLDLLMTADLAWSETIFTIFMDEVMIVTGLVGALVASQYKWGFFVFAMLALFWVFYSVVFVARKQALLRGKDTHQVFLICGVWTMFIWFLYPIAWGLAEGGNVISPDSEVVFYGILDIMAKPVFGMMLLLGHSRITSRSSGDTHLHDKKSRIDGDGQVDGSHDVRTHNGVRSDAVPMQDMNATRGTGHVNGAGHTTGTHI